MKEEQKDLSQSLSDEKQKAAEEYRRESYSKSILPNIDGPMPEYGGNVKAAFIAGAEWQKEQMMKDGNVILAEEDFDAEKEKSIEWGYNLCKEQMLKDAVGGEICGRVYDHINVRFADGVCKYLEPKNISHIPADVSKHNIGDKVRIVVLKAEEE